jgi:redox-sensing transcriptional repressor
MLDRLRDLIPEPALRRLPWYLAYVSLLRERGVEHVSSTGIARGINVDASQIAKDLSFLDIKGKTRIGYEVALLEHKLEEFLGFRKRHRAAIIGVGSLGRALMQDSGLTNYGLEVVAGFDVDPAKIGSEHEGIPVYDVASLGEKARELGMEIGIVTVPVEYAQDAADSIVEAEGDMEFHPLSYSGAGGYRDCQHLHLCPSRCDV